jgi:hypothetical protein
MDASGFRQERNHVGTDFMVERNGIEVVATVPGRIIWLGPDPNGGWGIDILTDVDGYTSGVFHLKPMEGLTFRMGGISWFASYSCGC